MRTIASHKTLLPSLIEIDTQYKPAQVSPVYKLLGKLEHLAGIFMSCLGKQDIDGEENSKIT